MVYPAATKIDINLLNSVTVLGKSQLFDLENKLSTEFSSPAKFPFQIFRLRPQLILPFFSSFVFSLSQPHPPLSAIIGVYLTDYDVNRSLPPPKDGGGDECH